MNEFTSGILVQIACYAALMLMTIFGIAFLLRGFFWKYVKVRTSFGRLLLVKIRTPLRDHYAIGWVEENFLCYKTKDHTIRMAVRNEDKIFYRNLGITMVDVDEEKNAICKVDYTPVTGFDAKKHSDLLTRALMRPAITSNQEKIILVCVILAVIIAGVSAFFAFQASQSVADLSAKMPAWVSTAVNNALERFTGGINTGGVTGTNATATPPTTLG